MRDEILRTLQLVSIIIIIIVAVKHWFILEKEKEVLFELKYTSSRYRETVKSLEKIEETYQEKLENLVNCSE